MNLEKIIFSNLIFNETYARKVIPYLKKEYFNSTIDANVFDLINTHVNEYNNFPSKEILLISLANKTDLNEETFKECGELIEDLDVSAVDNTDNEWLLKETEKYCQNRAIYNAIYKSIKILEDDDGGRTGKGAIPELLSEALGVSFDNAIGHDFIADSKDRFDFYHTYEEKIPFNIGLLNVITKGGLPRKTLNVILAGTGVGKTLAMCHFAAQHFLMGKNVLYITLEMSQERIAERIDANLLDVPLDDLVKMKKETYFKRLYNIKQKTNSKLIIKEYPTATASAANFRHLLNELKIKKNFVPDVIYIDYLNICVSSRVKYGSNVGSYNFIKSVAEELRGLAVEADVPIITATQTTRSGYSSSDPDLTDTSESFGLPATADFMIGIVSTEELAELGQIMMKQLKNRYGDLSIFNKFTVGIDKSRMKLYDLENSAQDSFYNNQSSPDDDIDDDNPFTGKFDKSKFAGFK